MTITRFPAPTIDSNGRLDVVQHAHPDSTHVHLDFTAGGTGTSVDLIMVDLSDTTNWHHTHTGAVHIEELYVEVDAQVNADYDIILGFLKNVGATDGDFYELTHVAGSKTAGQQKNVSRKFYPNGPYCSSNKVVTSDITLNDTSFNTATNMKTVRDPATANTPPADGDLVLRIMDNGGGGANTNFTVEVNFSYHSHA